MPSTAQSSNIDILGEPECRSLLAIGTIGRVGFVDAYGPMILPVNYVVAEGLVAFRSDSASLLAHVPMQSIAFEVDGWDGPERAWSVVARGHAREVTTALGERYEHLRAAHVPTLLDGALVHWYALEAERLSGRMITTR